MSLLPLLLAGASLGTPQHIVVVLADDVGVDRIGAYMEHPDPGHTPNIDRLAAEGLLFRNAWSNPFCSPSRACVLTGRYGFRTGVGAPTKSPGVVGFQAGLPIDEVSMPDALGPGWRTAALGKWHLADSTQGPAHPNDLGFGYYAGSLFNIGFESVGAGYFDWRKTVNGVELNHHHVYATTDTVDESIAALAYRGPSFLWVAFNSAHAPLHAPPPHLHTFQLSGPPGQTPVVHVKAMIEALDAELGRLLDAAGPDTLVIFLGDNGTDEDAIDAPFPPDHGKGTLYEGGVNVPLIIAGPGVQHGESAALVNITDVFATVAELAGRPSFAEDSVSLVPYFSDPDRPSLRRWVYAEFFRPNGPGPPNMWRQAIRGPRYKVIVRKNDPDELYDLSTDRFEAHDLLLEGPLSDPAREAYIRLKDSRPHVY